MFAFLIPVAHAQISLLTPPTQCNFATGILHFDCIPAYIAMLTGAVITFTATISLIMLMYNGFRYMFGPLTDGSTDAAKKGIMYSIIGLIVSLLAYAIVEIVVSTLIPF